MRKRILSLRNLLISETARNTYAVFLGNILSAFFSFLFTVILVRLLTLADFGYFSALLSLMLLAGELSDIGIGQSLSSFLPPLYQSKIKLNNFLKAALMTQIVISLVVSLLIISMSKQLSLLLFHSTDFAFFVVLTAVSIFCYVIANFVNYSLSARKKFLPVAFLTAFGSLVRMIFLLFVIILTKVNLNNAVYAQTLSLIFLLTVSLL